MPFKIANKFIPRLFMHYDGDSGKKNPNKPAVGLYVHIPYCRRRCRYCDFAIVPIGDGKDQHTNPDFGSQERLGSRSEGFRRMDETYRGALLEELRLISTSSTNTNAKPSLQSVYFGGGTPSLAPISTIKAILDAAVYSDDSPFQLQDDAELTIEMDPGTFTLRHLSQLRDCGFNRISLGIQSFDDAILDSLGRVHNRQDIYDSISIVRQVFGERANYSIDLISGLPGLSLGKWAETLQIATTTLDPTPTHVSVYDLQVEEGTVFGRWYGNSDNEKEKVRTDVRDSPTSSTRRQQLPSSDECAFMYRYGSAYLRKKGYEHYEISSYAQSDNDNGVSAGGLRNRHRSQHNQIYWDISGEWYAVGLGATSSIGNRRYARPRAFADYIAWVKKISLEQQSPAEGANSTILPQGLVSSPKPWNPPWRVSTDPTSIDDIDAIQELIMTRLRTVEGLDLTQLRDVVNDGDDLVDAVLRGSALAVDLGLATVTRQDDNLTGTTSISLRLSDPDGFLFSNTIISSIFVEIDSSTGNIP